MRNRRASRFSFFRLAGSILRITGGLWLCAVLLSPGNVVAADDPTSLEAQIEALRKEHAAIRAELQAIRQLLQQREPSSRNTEVRVEGSPFIGDASAKVTVIEFTSYECSFCARHFHEVMPKLVKDYVKPGKVKYVIRGYASASLSRAPSKAAETVHCAADQGYYWEMRELLFDNLTALHSQDLPTLVDSLGLDVSAVQACLRSGKYTERIEKDLQEGRSAGVRGTPTFLFGLTDPGGSTIRVTKMLRGNVPYAQFQAVIDTLLSKKVSHLN